MRANTETLAQHIEAIRDDAQKSPAARIRALIGFGLQVLDLEIGIVSRISDGKYTVMYTNQSDLDGQIFDLGNTYCSVTLGLTSEPVLAIKHFAISEYFRHPAYSAFKLETYIGTPIYANGQRYGTLNFTRQSPRLSGFDASDRQLVQMLGTAIGTLLAETDTA